MPKPNEVKFTITINATYDADSVGDPDIFKTDLTRTLDRVIGEGLLSPTWTEVVEEFDTEVRYVGDDEDEDGRPR